MMESKKVFLVTNIPTPYRIPLFNEIASQFEARGWRLKVLFSARGYPRRQWEIDWGSIAFDHEVLGGKPKRLGRHENYRFYFPGLLRAVSVDRPEVVICPGFSIATAKMRLARMWKRTPYIIWSGETLRRARLRKSWLRERYIRFLIARASACIAYGSEAKAHLTHFGAPASRVLLGVNTVETAVFKDAAANPRGRDLGGRYVLLAVTNLVAAKQVDSLLDITEMLSRVRHDFVLRIVGDGPEGERLRQSVSRRKLDDFVEFTGFLQREQVAAEMASATCFLFPTANDVWGLVLVEAMSAGLPCLASIHAGATADLVIEGETGYAVNFQDTASVVERLNPLLAAPERLAAMGKAAQERIDEMASLRASARGFVDAVACCIDGRRSG